MLSPDKSATIEASIWRLRKKLAQLSRKHEATKREASATLGIISSLQTAREVAEHQRRMAIEEASSFKGKYDAIRYSTSFRALAPARRLADNYPKTARFFRRFMKVAWWTITFKFVSRYNKLGLKTARHSTKILSPLNISNKIGNDDVHSIKCTSEAISTVWPMSRSVLNGNERYDPVGSPLYQAPDVEVSIIIVANRDQARTENCLCSISRNGPDIRCEVILIAPSSDSDIVSDGLETKYIASNGAGAGAALNQGVAAAHGAVLCFLSSEVIVTPDWLASLIEVFEDLPDTAIAGGMLVDEHGRLENAGWRVLGDGRAHSIGRGASPLDGAFTYRRPVDGVAATCFAVPRSIMQRLGGFSESITERHYAVLDLAFRGRELGLKSVYEPRCRVIRVSGSPWIDEIDATSIVEGQRRFATRFSDRLRKHPWDTTDDFVIRRQQTSGPVVLVLDDSIPQPDCDPADVTMSRYLSLLGTGGWRVIFGPLRRHAHSLTAAELERQGIEVIRPPATIESWLAAHGSHVDEIWIAQQSIPRDVMELISRHTTAKVRFHRHDQQDVSEEGKPSPECRNQKTCASPFSNSGLEMQEGAEESTLSTFFLPPYCLESNEIRQLDTSYFETKSDVVFPGDFSRQSDVTAAVYISREVMPAVFELYPDTKLYIVGDAPPLEVQALSSKNIVVTGDDVDSEPFLDRSRLVIAALQPAVEVSGTLVDALRRGMPVITNWAGAKGAGIVAGRHALVANNTEGLFHCVSTLLSDVRECARLSAEGAELMRMRFSRREARRSLSLMLQKPRCSICGSANLADRSESNMREAFACLACYSLNRMEALARVMLARLAQSGEASMAELAFSPIISRIHEFGFVGGIAETLSGQPWYSVSEYFDDVPPGEMGPNGIQCQDLGNLTFANESFDLVLSQDVMEHVPDPAKAFAETARVLRPGGSHVFTIPFDYALEHSVTRARITLGEVEHLHSPEYHGDPIRSQGALVFTDFGRDLVDIVRAAGLTLYEHDITLGSSSSEQIIRVFEARRL